MSKSPLKILPAVIVAIAAVWLAHPAWAINAEPTLTLTETSKTQLNWSWDAVGGGSSGSITAVLADQWLNTSISGPTLSALAEGSGSWTEPEDAGFRNFANVAYTPTGWIIVTVLSDVSGTGISDGTAADFGGFQVKFFDTAATSETAAVPDPGTTFSLFGFSLMGLGFLRRKLR